MANISTRLDLLVTRLRDLQNQFIEILEQVGENDYQIQFQEDLSPIGWHLGHCVFTETYWIKEAWLGLESCNDQLKRLYIPEFSKKSLRGQSLPEFLTLKKWAQEQQQTNIRLLVQHQLSDHHLAYDHFILRFLIQHYAQHLETIQMILHLKAIQESRSFEPEYSHTSVKTHEKIQLSSGKYTIGNNRNNFFYDNELTEHEVTLNSFFVAKEPISNGEYLAFINDGGYERLELWPSDAQKWLHLTTEKHPVHWQKNKQGHWYEVTTTGPQNISSDKPVYGINWYEASAFANWSNARLPHEYEWEAAAKSRRLENTGIVWEWCSNNFHPYPEFKAYPYDGYSIPYFDGNHFVLKGGSQYTQEEIKRVSFRNYYEPDKRYQFAGLRLAYDQE